MTTMTRLTPSQAAARLGRGVKFVLALIHAKELNAFDERRPGAASPRYYIEEHHLEEWRRSRRTVGAPEQPEEKATKASRDSAVLPLIH